MAGIATNLAGSGGSWRASCRLGRLGASTPGRPTLSCCIIGRLAPRKRTARHPRPLRLAHRRCTGALALTLALRGWAVCRK
eukprot:10882837-Alexandrium_andersonii.AAC.1